MKRLLSLLLTVLMLFTAVSVIPSASADTAPAFKEGDELYLKIENPSNWADGAAMYVNFTSASRADNGSKSVIIAEADKSRYDPYTGVTYDGSRRLYKYTVTADNAGSTVMRFWRGNSEKLWNESVAITAADFVSGKNTAVITDWTDTGYLTSTFDYTITSQLTLSADKGEVGDSFDITLTHTEVPSATYTYEILINDTKVSDTAGYTFIPDSDGAYSVKASVKALSESGRTLATDSKSAVITVGSAPVTVLQNDLIYAHAAADGADDSEAWIKPYRIDNTLYYFMPSSAKAYDTVELFNSYNKSALIDGVEIPANGTGQFKAEADKSYRVVIGTTSLSVRFMFSTAEAALWVNNTDTFSGYRDFFAYLKADKANSVAATGAVSTPDGKIESADVKKMKGRGNTSWNADKKGFNVTFVSALKLAGMDKCKKFSLVSNFQDAAMARNRILFDLADEVGVPYSSDSRFIDLYTNGVYQGTYQICQKIDVGKNTLIPDFEEDDYLDTATGGVKSDFSFVAEIDSSPSADDFHFNASNGNNLTMKAPELASDDPNYSAARTYIRTKYNSMYNNLQKATVAEYLDITSMAEVYIINELGKNWDSGASSFYFTYKPDADGKYKFFASPVWDYDNSLGNARGVSYDLYNLGINDYTLPTGWFASKKNGYTGPNVLAESVKNPLIMAEVRRVWFEEFVPAIKTLTSKGIGSGELYSSDVYADILRGTADMNYKIWPIDTNGSWTADHGSLLRYSADYTENTYGQVTGVTLNRDSSSTSYDQYTFDGQFDYMMDWLTSRAAWMSAQYISGYTPSEPVVKPTEEPTQEPTQEPTLPAEDIIEPELTGALVAWIFDSADKISGNKLTEYGSSDEGYAATLGSGKLTLTVSGEKSRALEWSEPEYGKSGALITPIMSAGGKNPWGSPYVRFEIPATEYEGMSLTLYLAGSNKCPAEWKLQYSTDGETFTDIEGAVAKISPDSRKLLTAYFDKTALPDFKYDCFHNTVILQLVPTSMTTVEGGDATITPSSGELAINDAVLYGAKLDYDDVRMGDVDLSGEADIVDVTYLQRYSIKMYSITARQLKAADVLRNGEVDITDVTYLQRQLTSGGGSL